MTDARFDAAETPGLAVVLRALPTVDDDEQVLALAGRMFVGLRACYDRPRLDRDMR